MPNRLLLGALTVMLAACAARAPVMPPAPAVLSHPEFQYPTVPKEAQPLQATRIERGWRYLQSDNLRSAEREFQSALKTQPGFYPAETALGYVDLARRDAKQAIERFDRALEGGSAYVPALVGRGQALLELGRDGDALVSFESALQADPSLRDLQGRIEVLRFRALQDNLARAKAASDAGRLDEARAAYGQAVAASPDSAFLYRDLAVVERKAGEPELAFDHFSKAIAIDPSDAVSHAGIAAILEARGDVAGAIAAYERARALDPELVPAQTLTRLREAEALVKLPEEYRAIPAAANVTRGELAALLGVRLSELLSQARPRQAVVTDLRGHWAEPWILSVVRSGVMETQPNYTFQPRLRVRRVELAQIVARVLSLVAATRPAAAKDWQSRIKIADVPQSHLVYPAAAQAVAAGVMRLDEKNAFQLLGDVSGADAIEAVARLEALARP